MNIIILFLYQCCFAFYHIKAENLCEKLDDFGDNIQTKAILAPIIIIGKGGMKIDLPNAKYKLTIDIIKTIKGSLGEWKSSILMAGEFSTFKDSNSSCQFQSLQHVEQLYFLQTISVKNGEFKVLFNPEVYNDLQLDNIYKSICTGCGKKPIVTVKDVSKSVDFLVAECMSDGYPTPVTKWKVQKKYLATIIENIKGGVRLIQPINNLTNEVQVCEAVNVMGSASYSIVVKPIIFKSQGVKIKESQIIPCSSNDEKFCNGNGKCYEDKSEKNSKFCRCKKGFMEPNCVTVSRTVSKNMVERLKNLDKKFCNNQGISLKNYTTQTTYCECYLNFFGNNCEKKYYMKTPVNVSKNMVERLKNLDKKFCNNQGISLKNYTTQTTYCECYLNFFGNNCEKKYYMKTPVNEGLKEFISEQNSKLAVKYIIIGCLIVLAGCILTVIVIVCLWRFYFTKRHRRIIKVKNDKKSENETKISNSENIIMPIPPNEENSLLLTNLKPKKIQSNDNSIYDKENRLKISNLNSGNGIYDNY